VIFVHGCFWHRHTCRFGRPRSKTRSVFWEEKIRGNVRRDGRQLRELAKMGWRTMVLWQCEDPTTPQVRKRLKTFLGPPKASNAVRWTRKK
jgi:DNA mismatch endonuclease (patch repair protein)